MKKVFVCSPYSGDIEESKKKVTQAAKIACGCNYIPIVPHLYFPQFLDENDEFERIRGIEFGLELMKDCDFIWLIGPEISAGMEYELEAAKGIGIPVKMYDEQFRPIHPKTLTIDKRVDKRFRDLVKGLKFE